MFNRLSLKGIQRSNRKKMRKSKGKERKVEDSSEVREVFHKELQIVTGKDLDSDFKEVQVKDKEMDTDIANAETEMEVVATVESDKLSDISFGEDLHLDMEKNDADGTSGMEEAMDEESENNKEKYISPKDEKVKEGESKKKRIPTGDKTTKGKIASKRIREVRENKESLSKEKFVWMLKDQETNWTKRMERFILNMNRAVYWNPTLMDLRGIDMVFMPMLEHDHYYLIVFELKHIAISVIDNFNDGYPLVRLDDHANYFEKDLSYKGKEIFAKYLEHVKHPKTDELNATKIKKVKIPWATTANALDCAIFVMRHMEKYMGPRRNSIVA
ncbi:hypothetical protein L1987_54364 [Smallanthus sonchifolius]|uniref:Uncharacterized protein n=1 Tax=Smallanthus sonchifolius TaxID=185202 RepID=A0ACB9E6X6_9ASTR|nr:hypothetical protein L1987_54364 [Smallanthus sonchifolius]